MFYKSYAKNFYLFNCLKIKLKSIQMTLSPSNMFKNYPFCLYNNYPMGEL